MYLRNNKDPQLGVLSSQWLQVMVVETVSCAYFESPTYTDVESFVTASMGFGVSFN